MERTKKNIIKQVLSYVTAIGVLVSMGVTGMLSNSVDCEDVVLVESSADEDELVFMANQSKNTYTYCSHPASVTTFYNDGVQQSICYNNYKGKLYVLTEGSDEYITISNPFLEEMENVSECLYGGCFAGVNYNYVVFGRTNHAEDAETAVIRVQQYTKDWILKNETSLKDCNTTEPFRAGNCRMVEDDGKLYFYTSHLMYAYEGVRHQANMIFTLDSETLAQDFVYGEIMNREDTGYISHSFDQYIEADGDKLYCLDLGDHYPRSISLVERNKKVENGDWGIKALDVMEFPETNGVVLGTSIGGFSMRDDCFVIAGNTIDYDAEKDTERGQRNIFMSVVSRDFQQNVKIDLTSYASGDGVIVGTPQLVQVSSTDYYVFWEEEPVSDGFALSDKARTFVTRVTLAEVDDGFEQNSQKYVTVSPYVRLSVHLSDCQPVISADGRSISWVVISDSGFYNCQVALADLESYFDMCFDVSGDGLVNIADVVLLSSYLLGGEVKSEDYHFDINNDGVINIFDMLRLRRYMLRGF